MTTGPVTLARFAVLAALVFLISSQAHAETGIEKAQKLVDDHKAVIARFMHPTSALDRILCTKTRRYETGEFYLIYAFYFDGDRYHSDLRFRFFEDGSLDSVEVAGTSTWIKPFQASDLALKAVTGLAPPPINERVIGLLKEGATRTALEFWLRSRK